MEIWLAVLSVVGGGLAGFVTSWWQISRTRNDSRQLAAEAISHAAAQRIIDVLATLDKRLDEFDHMIFMTGHVDMPPEDYEKLVAESGTRVEKVWQDLWRSVMTDAPLLTNRLLADYVLDLACKICSHHPSPRMGKFSMAAKREKSPILLYLPLVS